MQHHHDHGGDEDERILYTVEDWTPKGVVNTIWSFARTGVSPPPYLMQRLMARAEETVCAFSPPELSTFCWSLASIKHRPSKSLIAVIQERFEETHTAYHGRQVCDIIWAISVLQPFVFKETFLRTLEARATHLVADLDSSQVSKMLWSLASLGVDANTHLVTLLVETSLGQKPSHTLPTLARLGGGSCAVGACRLRWFGVVCLGSKLGHTTRHSSLPNWFWSSKPLRGERALQR